MTSETFERRVQERALAYQLDEPVRELPEECSDVSVLDVAQLADRRVWLAASDVSKTTGNLN